MPSSLSKQDDMNHVSFRKFCRGLNEDNFPGVEENITQGRWWKGPICKIRPPETGEDSSDTKVRHQP